jgi:hypothetical protein
LFYWSPVAELRPFKKHFDEFAPKGTSKTFIAALKWVCRGTRESDGRECKNPATTYEPKTRKRKCTRKRTP